MRLLAPKRSAGVRGHESCRIPPTLRIAGGGEGPRCAKLSKRFAAPTATVLLAFSAALGGCAGPTQKPLADWHDAVVAVREQSATTFRGGVNDLVREAQLTRAATLPSLKESDFTPGLDADSIAAWNRALDSLAAYSAALATLLSPELAAGVGDSTKRLGESIATSSKSDLLAKQPGLASALGKLGAKLASVTATRSAKDIMAQTDSAVSETLGQMARMINDDSGGKESGIYQTVYTNWTTQANEIRGVDFLSAQTPADKRNVAARYAAVLDQRAIAAAALLSLRRSLLDLAAAHSRAAAGGPMDTSVLIANVHEQTAFLKSLLADLKPAKN